MGTFAVFALRASRRRSVRSAAILPTFSGDSEFFQSARDRVPVVALHGSVIGLRDGDCGHGAIGALVFADESVGVGEDFVSGGGVERSAFGVLDARIEIERGFFGAAGVVDAVGAGERVDVFVVEIEIAGELAELVGCGNAAEGIFGCDLRQRQRRGDHAVEAGSGEVGGVGRGGALSEEDADADGFGAGFFQGLDLAEADERGEFIAFADDAFGGGGASGHGAADDIWRRVVVARSFQFRVRVRWVVSRDSA